MLSLIPRVYTPFIKPFEIPYGVTVTRSTNSLFLVSFFIETKIPMTCPVLETVLHGVGPDCESNFTYHFMVPFVLQNSAPKPTNPAVYLTTLPEMSIYVR